RSDQPQAAKPVPINQRPRDNENEWKGNPYALDHWGKPALAAFHYSCDDPQVAWCADVRGRFWMTRDGGRTWRDMTVGLMGAQVRNLVPSDTRTFIVWARTDRG